ncbi:MAG: hypothetical protein IKB06_00555 [Clostridia bacterium]|nr:hypothetical protein [Clostridia bacterium]
MWFKLVCLILLTVAAFVSLIVPKIFSEKKYPHEKRRLQLIVRVRMGLFLGMMVLLFLCVIV